MKPSIHPKKIRVEIRHTCFSWLVEDICPCSLLPQPNISPSSERKSKLSLRSMACNQEQDHNVWKNIVPWTSKQWHWQLSLEADINYTWQLTWRKSASPFQNYGDFLEKDPSQSLKKRLKLMIIFCKFCYLTAMTITQDSQPVPSFWQEWIHLNTFLHLGGVIFSFSQEENSCLKRFQVAAVRQRYHRNLTVILGRFQGFSKGRSHEIWINIGTE